MVLKYHGKLDFAKLEYPKSDRFLHIFETVVDCNIICKKGAIWLFFPHKEKRNNTKIHMKEMREKRKIAEKYKREKERKSVEKS